MLTKDNLIEFYDRRYQNGYMEKHDKLDLYKVFNTLDEISVDAKTVLDYGCGQGSWFKILSNKFPNAEIYGLDISFIACKMTAKRIPQCNIVTFNGETSPFKDNSFDLIFSWHVLEHVWNIENTVFDISRLLKEDRYACIIFPCGNKNSFEEYITRLIRGGKEDSVNGRKRFYYEDYGHIRRMKSKEIIALFKKNNVEIYKEFYSNHFLGAINWICKHDPVFIYELFNINRAVNVSSKVKLQCLRLIFLPIFSVPRKFVRIVKEDLNSHLKANTTILRKAVFFIKIFPVLTIFIPIKAMLILFDSMIRILALFEWWSCKTRKNGSEQYLIFKKHNRSHRPHTFYQ